MYELSKNGEPLCKDGARPWIFGRSAAHGKEAGKGTSRDLHGAWSCGSRSNQIIEVTKQRWEIK